MDAARRRLGGRVKAIDTLLTPAVSPKDVIERFWPVLRPYRGRLALALLFAMVSPLIDTLSISLYGRLVDDVLVPRQLTSLGLIAAAYIGLTFCGGVVGFGRSYLAAWISEHLLFDLRGRLFTHLQSLPLGFFERSRLGDTVARVTEDVDELGEFLASGLADAVAYLLKIVSFVGALFFIDARLALIALVVAPPFWFFGRFFARRVKVLAREQRGRARTYRAPGAWV